MGVCQDPRLTYLNDLGYNVVRLPRKGINPLGILGKDKKSLDYLGTLDQIWSSPNHVPAPGPPNPVAALNGAKTSDIKLSVGIEILANALAGMFGATAPSLKPAYQAAKTVQFTFQDVQAVGVDPFLVGNYLASGDLKSNAFVAHYFGENDAEAFIITEILQAKSIAVTGKNDSGTEVAVDVPAIQATLGAKVTVSASTTANTQVAYTGLEYLTFGFKVFGIGIANGVWQIHGVAPGAVLAFADAGVLPEPVLLRRDGFVEISMAAV